MKNKIYAKQVPPEYQESPLFLTDFWPENVFVFGNRDFNQHADTLNELRTALENIVEVFDDMQQGQGWTNDLAFAIRCELPEEYRREYSRPERLKLVELANEYCFAKSYEENDVLCKALELITGGAWNNGTIRGCCQGDWQEIIYPTEYGREWLDTFESEYFNTGTEWIVNVNGCEMGVYTYSWNSDGTREEIAGAVGADPTDVVLLAFDGWSQTAKYKEVM